ncbi:MAG: hypothetical protein EHM20_17725 [Alphaproteobacteria bacterium]|nr:MAG: hypothetical protein EHM20_17725 [Alphaproteobacteria bacterium]
MRNQTFEKLKRTLGFLLAVFFVVSFTAASVGAPSSASPSQEAGIESVSPYQYNEPNLFTLQGVGQKYRDVQISYSTSSITGQPLFNYKDSKGSYSFKGDEIRTQKTGIGTMVTVTLETVPDLHVKTLTLLVPAINLDGSAREFKTIAIRTTSKTTIGGPRLVKGPIQSYEVIDLKGTANSVVF